MNNVDKFDELIHSLIGKPFSEVHNTIRKELKTRENIMSPGGGSFAGLDYTGDHNDFKLDSVSRNNEQEKFFIIYNKESRSVKSVVLFSQLL